MSNVAVYYRRSLMEPEELRAAERHFLCVPTVALLPTGTLVVQRYSTLPFARDQHEEMLALGLSPLVSLTDHAYCASVQSWVQDLGYLTPRTWTRLEDIPEQGVSFVLKGDTNSRKDRWKTHMYADGKAAAIQVYQRLMEDGLIRHQQVVIREFVPLRRLATGLDGMPISEEYRFFCLDGKVLAGGFYWTNYLDDISEKVDSSSVPPEFMAEVLHCIGDKARFVVVDVARTADGSWIVVELNCGSMSGLAGVDANALYGVLKRSLYEEVAGR